MGNQVSKGGSDMSLDSHDKMALYVDLIANRIILKEVKQNASLSDSGRCSQLIIITSEILKRLPFKVISYMNRKRNILGNGFENYAASENVLMLDTAMMTSKENGLDEADPIKKAQMCIGIARFYVQIGNLFDAIMSTIKPYDYLRGSTTSAPVNFCDLLSNSLFDQNNFEKYSSNNMSRFVQKQRDMDSKLARLSKLNPENEQLNPSVCSVYKNIKDLQSSSSSSSSSSSRKSIFSRLDRLYLDVYQERHSLNSKPEFIEMTKKMKQNIYLPDVHAMYKAVTGRDAGPEIQSFGDIPFDVSRTSIREKCKDDEKAPKKGIKNTVIVDDSLRTNQYFENYIEHIRSMIRKTNQQRGELIALLDKIFVISKKTDTEIQKIYDDFGRGSKRVEGLDVNNNYSRNFQKYLMFNNFYINPQLTDSMLQKIINEARVKIVRMYVMCQDNFVKGVELLEAMHANVKLRYESQMMQGALQGQANMQQTQQQQQQQQQSEDEIIEKINSELGASRAGESFQRLMTKIDDAMSTVSSKKKPNINLLKDRISREITEYIDRAKQRNKDITDDSTNREIRAIIEEYKRQFAKIIE